LNGSRCILGEAISGISTAAAVEECKKELAKRLGAGYLMTSWLAQLDF
jgi:hypothetical protein